MSNVVIGTIHLPGDALIPTFVNATDTLYFPIEATDNVSVISGSTLGVVANFSVGDSYLQTPAYDPANGDLYFPELSGAQPGEFGAVGVVDCDERPRCERAGRASAGGPDDRPGQRGPLRCE